MKARTSYCGVVSKKVESTIEIELTENDIFNWLTNCDDKETLKYLGNYARTRYKELSEKQPLDDFRSRA